MIDIGVNLTNKAFDEDRDAVIARARQAGIETLVVTGTDLRESASAVALCRQWPAALIATAGIHPHNAGRAPADWRRRLSALHEEAPVRAVGETGLDFNRNFSPREAQIELFRGQIDLAIELGKPLFVHDRDTRGMTAAVLAERAAALREAGVAVVVHCFTGSGEELAAYLEADYYIGITGWVCDERRGLALQELVGAIPDERLLVETDAPFLTPRTIPARQRSRRNEPANLVWVVRKLAELRGQPFERLAQLTERNARRFFALPERP